VAAGRAPDQTPCGLARRQRGIGGDVPLLDDLRLLPIGVSGILHGLAADRQAGVVVIVAALRTVAGLVPGAAMR